MVASYLHSELLFVTMLDARAARNRRSKSIRAQSAVDTVSAQETSSFVLGDDDVVMSSPDSWNLPLVEERPGYKDHASFHEGESVTFWQDQFDAQSNDFLKGVDLNGVDAAYWVYHFGRTGFFAVQGLASIAVANVAVAMEGTSGGVEVTPTFLRNFTKSPDGFVRRITNQAIQTFRQDLRYVKQGFFKLPYDMSPRHRQWSPAYIATKGLRYINEAVGVMKRSSEKADTSTWLESENKIYPPYFRHTFHYQTDGWLSSESAQVYETSTETLFQGRQDAMQRTTLVHIASHMRVSGISPSDVKLLEIGCGTGRFNTFMRDNWPEMDVTASDLSPYYLEEARKNGAYWEREFAPPGARHATFVQANAEALPFKSGSFDFVVSVYLFHELPAEAQDAVFSEVARLLIDGGMFVLTDSMQLGDRPALDGSIGNFGDFAEPHYQAYIRRDLASMARAYGLEPASKELSSATKSISFIKPKRGASKA